MCDRRYRSGFLFSCVSTEALIPAIDSLPWDYGYFQAKISFGTTPHCCRHCKILAQSGNCCSSSHLLAGRLNRHPIPPAIARVPAYRQPAAMTPDHFRSLLRQHLLPLISGAVLVPKPAPSPGARPAVVLRSRHSLEIKPSQDAPLVLHYHAPPSLRQRQRWARHREGPGQGLRGGSGRHAAGL